MLQNDDWTDLESNRGQSGMGFLGEDDEQEDTVMQGLRDDVARGLDDGWSPWTRRWCARCRSEREHDYKNKKCWLTSSTGE